MAEPNFNQALLEQLQLSNVASSFNDPDSFPDLTVTLSGHTSWLCHKHILCKWSDYFSTLVTGGFKESGANAVEVHDTDAHAFEAGLEYCYKLGNISFQDRAQDGEMSIAVFHVRLFQVAEYYSIKGLEGLAADEFIKAINSDEVTTQQLAEAFQEVYERTSDPDKLLRKAITDRTLSNVKFYLGDNCPSFAELIKAKPEFMDEVGRAMARTFLAKRATPGGVTGDETMYYCPYCNGSGAFVAPEIGVGRGTERYTRDCLSCNRTFTKRKAVWRKFHKVQSDEDGEGGESNGEQVTGGFAQGDGDW